MNYYEILGITEKAKYEEIRKAYHKMALRYHPDKCTEEDAEEKFRQVVEAYEVLVDPVKRRRYDLSRKLDDNYNFTLPNDILKFSKYFFSEKNIQKFRNMGQVISQQAENFGVSINFEIMLHSFLNNIRNGKYHSLIEEYQMFKKFYETDNRYSNQQEEKVVRNNYKKQKEEYEERKRNEDQKKTVSTVSKINKNKFRNKCVTVNVSVNLENVYQREIKVATLEVDKMCSKCQGSGVVYLENQNRKNKNSKSRYRKKNLSRKKNDNNSFLDKKICAACQGTTKIKETQKYLIDTSMDKICYLEQYFVNAEESYYDLIFNLNIKPHSLYKVDKKNRYDIFFNQDITLGEFYYGGNLKIPFLDSTNLDVKWDGLNNGKFQNTIKIPNKGLLVIPENNYIVNKTKSLVSNYKLDDASRGNLLINLNLKIPILTELQLKDNQSLIQDMVEITEEENKNLAIY